MKRQNLFVLKIVAIGVLMILLRVTFGARQEQMEAQEHLSNNRWEEAVIHFDRCAHWYFPGNPYVTGCIQKLWNLGTEVEASAPKRALMAYDSLRAAIMGTRSFYLPHRRWLERANERIAHLRAREHVELQKDLTYEEAFDFHWEALSRSHDPKRLWVAVLLGGFLGWVAALFLLIWKGFDSTGQIHWRKATPWIGAFVCSFGLWIIGMLRA